jgi:hypothetical protein
LYHTLLIPSTPFTRFSQKVETVLAFGTRHAMPMIATGSTKTTHKKTNNKKEEKTVYLAIL